MDQKTLWNTIHTKGKQDAYAETQTEFATEAIGYFPAQAAIIDLGCGLGMDANFFAKQGHTVTPVGCRSDRSKAAALRRLNNKGITMIEQL